MKRLFWFGLYTVALFFGLMWLALIYNETWIAYGGEYERRYVESVQEPAVGPTAVQYTVFLVDPQVEGRASSPRPSFDCPYGEYDDLVFFAHRNPRTDRWTAWCMRDVERLLKKLVPRAKRAE